MPRASFILFLLFTSACYAQTEFGIKAGLNLSDVVITNYINPDVESDLNIKTGLHAGFYLNGMANEQFGLAAELLYSNKGFQANNKIHLHYITLPLLVQYKLSETIFAEIGPEPGYLFAARSSNGNESNIYNNKFDLALVAGFRLNTPRMLFGIRYCAGLFSVRETLDNNLFTGGEKIKYQNRVLQFSIGYKLWAVEGEMGE
jgi:hypothetical protein